ncbi:hypothetical protein M2347_002318 [Chryseobacterium sp. H1D6B]|nr:hypothetical protein [Chryseobacterium sp. H1D6B]
MYDYGWRQYMPELGRWNGIDQLAEKYLSTSSYAYVANNPVSYADIDGRWFNQDGSINTSGYTPGFTSGKAMLSQFLGQRPGEGGGGGYTFTGNAAASMFDYFAKGGSVSGMSFTNGEARWWTGGTATQTSYRIGDEMRNVDGDL